jgi:hypothetical protein
MPHANLYSLHNHIKLARLQPTQPDASQHPNTPTTNTQATNNLQQATSNNTQATTYEQLTSYFTQMLQAPNQQHPSITRTKQLELPSHTNT